MNTTRTTKKLSHKSVRLAPKAAPAFRPSCHGRSPTVAHRTGARVGHERAVRPAGAIFAERRLGMQCSSGGRANMAVPYPASSEPTATRLHEAPVLVQEESRQLIRAEYEPADASHSTSVVVLYVAHCTSSLWEEGAEPLRLCWCRAATLRWVSTANRCREHE